MTIVIVIISAAAVVVIAGIAIISVFCLRRRTGRKDSQSKMSSEPRGENPLNKYYLTALDTQSIIDSLQASNLHSGGSTQRDDWPTGSGMQPVPVNEYPPADYLVPSDTPAYLDSHHTWNDEHPPTRPGRNGNRRDGFSPVGLPPGELRPVYAYEEPPPDYLAPLPTPSSWNSRRDVNATGTGTRTGTGTGSREELRRHGRRPVASASSSAYPPSVYSDYAVIDDVEYNSTLDRDDLDPPNLYSRVNRGFPYNGNSRTTGPYNNIPD
ncbi:hypothetical protein EGW08_007320 [Elysia chlorotica]|uniref:Uncharacterized protein n=1 Tax=Elysia chlorotica TaxID=188477 RepID=A0A433TTM0_ELYCH|nr:hypothetical protein EGW08_007320 [Elysia chlorotica]